ncbi:uncharacterized protein K460DRAFT_405694 [Cucurbitaria berberidis CBS 394.84]|uniref:Uncharacterized protein n=1 Tax=Cucurbitaria berberidis CBS 394.84 TaxID=1168544 RepID=A0A9P4L7W9_9PLEO|nr:uncharacterized protein K460DRAFT_405694 [Cucurbitaria berberidis CBS 394.84]KAF1845435.1 hypothetical protein K460DRAFT_405694 [Cucurbitaria berberidis CBS 394.84]
MGCTSCLGFANPNGDRGHDAERTISDSRGCSCDKSHTETTLIVHPPVPPAPKTKSASSTLASFVQQADDVTQQIKDITRMLDQAWRDDRPAAAAKPVKAARSTDRGPLKMPKPINWDAPRYPPPSRFKERPCEIRADIPKSGYRRASRVVAELETPKVSKPKQTVYNECGETSKNEQAHIEIALQQKDRPSCPSVAKSAADMLENQDGARERGEMIGKGWLTVYMKGRNDGRTTKELLKDVDMYSEEGEGWEMIASEEEEMWDIVER